MKLEPIKSDRPDRAKPDAAKPEIATPEIAKPEVGKHGVGKREKLDFSKPRLRGAAAPRGWPRSASRDPGSRDPGSRDLLARAIPSELGAPDIGSRNPPLTDAALRVRLNTMLASPDLAAPGKEGAEGPGEGQADAEQAAEPAPDPVATKPLIAVERLSDVASAARNRRADVAPERETSKLTPGAPPLPVPAPEPEARAPRRLPGRYPARRRHADRRRRGRLGGERARHHPRGVPAQAEWGADGRPAIAAGRVIRGRAACDARRPARHRRQHARSDRPEMVDPDAYARFVVKRFTAVYRDREADDEILTR